MTIRNKQVEVRDLGLISYQEAWDLQERLLKQASDLKVARRNHPENAAPIPNIMLFCQHPHVYTLGKSGDIKNLLLSPAEMEAAEIEFFKINRGGDITYHGPGQIVGYPILDLENFIPDLHLYLRNIEEACILTCADYGLEAGRISGLTGVWIDREGPDPRKIMAIGVRCSRWITMHGFAFNVNTDLDYFGHIIPCGIDDKAVTSLQKELGRELDMEEVQGQMLEHLGEVFGWEG